MVDDRFCSDDLVSNRVDVELGGDGYGKRCDPVFDRFDDLKLDGNGAVKVGREAVSIHVGNSFSCLCPSGSPC